MLRPLLPLPLLFSVALPAAAQYHPFLPLHVGNEWVYEEKFEGETTGFSTLTVTGAPLQGARELRCERLSADGGLLAETNVAVSLPGFDVASPMYPAGCVGAVFGPGVTRADALIDVVYDEDVSVGAAAAVVDSTHHYADHWFMGSHGSGSISWEYASGIGMYAHSRTNCADSCTTVYTRLVYARIDGVEYGARSVGVEEGPAAVSFRLYPSPAATHVTVEAPTSTLSVFDLLGRRVAEVEAVAGQPVRLDVSSWPAGLYVARTVDGDEMQTARFVVARYAGASTPSASRTAGATTVPYSSIAFSTSRCGIEPTVSCRLNRSIPNSSCS